MRSPGEALCTVSYRQYEVEAGRKEIEGKIASMATLPVADILIRMPAMLIACADRRRPNRHRGQDCHSVIAGAFTRDISAEVHAHIRHCLEVRLGAEGRAVRLLYGGSVIPSNAREIFALPADLSPRRREFSLDPKTFGFYG
jgi:triosephosphate isomerase